MYVCLCNGVTERQVVEAIENGASSVADLSADLGVAMHCGTCAESALSLVQAYSPELNPSLYYQVA